MSDFPVSLAVYDLSRGMARQLGHQFLGIEIDMIPHTGVIVYGVEYFFGGGIQRLPHEEFAAMHGMRPTQILAMGRTQVPRHLFEDFLRQQSARFTVHTYDLLRNNCNNFSDACCRFLCGRTVPAEITGLPARVLATPMGQMLRPMLEQGQAALASGGGALLGPVVEPAVALSARAEAAAPPARAGNPWAAKGASATQKSKSNPWARGPLADADAGSAATSTAPGAAAAARAAAVAAALAEEASVLARHTQPLLSDQAQVAPLLCRQLRTLALSAAANGPPPPQPSPAQPPLAHVAVASAAAPSPASPPSSSSEACRGLLDAAELEVLRKLEESLVAGTSAAGAPAPGGASQHALLPAKAFALLHMVLAEWPARMTASGVAAAATSPPQKSGGQAGGGGGGDGGAGDDEAHQQPPRYRAVAVGLGLLRLCVLQPSAYAYMEGGSRAACLEGVVARLEVGAAAGAEEGDGEEPAGVQALRFAVVGNLFAQPSGAAFVCDDPTRLGRVTCAAARALRAAPPRPSPPPGAAATAVASEPSSRAAAESVRCMAAAVLHNLALALPLTHAAAPNAASPSSPLALLLAACLNGLASSIPAGAPRGESVVLYRRTVAAGILLRRFGACAVAATRSAGLHLEVAGTFARACRRSESGDGGDKDGSDALPEDAKKALRELNRLLAS